jgi:hypothetical protein
MNSLDLFDQLGSTIESRWRTRNFSDEAFPGICAASLTEFDLPSAVSPWDVVDLALSATCLPMQRDLPGRFGDPPITVWNSHRFHIDVYFWLHGTTSIHQHGFAGAFQVLSGESVHSSWNFTVSHVVTDAFHLGATSLKEVEILSVGDVRTIVAGREFIHSLFHLEQPSVTLVVRTNHAMLRGPQFDYQRPGIAVDPFSSDPTLTKQLQVISMLYQLRRGDADDRLATLLGSSDLASTYMILSRTRSFVAPTSMEVQFGLDRSVERRNRMFEVARERHGDLIGPLLAALQFTDQQLDIVSRRSFVTDTHLRFFLALVLNVPDAQRVMNIVAGRYPEQDPVELMLDWITELGTMRVAGSSLPNCLGIADFDHHDIELVEQALKGEFEHSENQDSRFRELRKNAILATLLT